MSDINQSSINQPVESVSPVRELALAARKFLIAKERDPILQILLLVDPIRAFADADIHLSKPARKLLRRKHPEAAYGNDELYKGVKSGSIKLSLIEKIELGNPRQIEKEHKIDPVLRKELEL